MKSLRVGFGNKSLFLKVKELSEFQMLCGLMFKTGESENLLFNKRGRWAIHSWFVFFPFLALWLDDRNKVLEWKIVKPFTSFAKPQKQFAKLVEIPLNERNRLILRDFPTIRGKV